MTMVMIMLTMLILLTLLMTISTRLMTIVVHSGAKAALVSPRFPLWGGLLGRSVSVTVRSSNLIIVRIIVKFLNIATIVKIMIVISQASLAFLLSFESSCTEQIFLSKWKRAFCKYQMAKTWSKENIQCIRWGARESIRERFKELSGEAADRFFVNYNQPWWWLVMFGDVWWCFRIIITMITLTSI